MFNTKGATAHEDAFMAIGFMADKLGTNLTRYMQFLNPALIMGLKVGGEPELLPLLSCRRLVILFHLTLTQP